MKTRRRQSLQLSIVGVVLLLIASVGAVKADGTPVLRGTATLGTDDDTELTPTVDLRITKTDDVTWAVPGAAQLTYEIVDHLAGGFDVSFYRSPDAIAQTADELLDTVTIDQPADLSREAEENERVGDIEDRVGVGDLAGGLGGEAVGPGDSLREIGVSRQKATYVLDLANKVSSGDVRLGDIHRKDDEEVIEYRIEGIFVAARQHSERAWRGV